MKVRLLPGFDRIEKLEKLCDQVSHLSREVEAAVAEWDQVVSEASKDAEAHQVSLVEVKEVVEKLHLQDAEAHRVALEAVVAKGRAELITELLEGFKVCVEVQNDDFERRCKSMKRVGFWKGVIHGRDMCNLEESHF